MSDKIYNYRVKCEDLNGSSIQVIICTPRKLSLEKAIAVGKYEISNDLKSSVVEMEDSLPIKGINASQLIMDISHFKK